MASRERERGGKDRLARNSRESESSRDIWECMHSIDGIARLTSQSDNRRRSVIFRFARSSLVQAHRMASPLRDLSRAADPEPVSRVATVLKYCSPWVALWALPISKASSDSSLLVRYELIDSCSLANGISIRYVRRDYYLRARASS